MVGFILKLKKKLNKKFLKKKIFYTKKKLFRVKWKILKLTY